MGISNRERLLQLKKAECPDSTFGGMPFPMVLQKAKGSWIWDVDGNQYLDLCSGFGSLALGHSHASLQDLIVNNYLGPQPRIIHGLGDVYSSEQKIQLVTRLSALLPGPARLVGLALSGSQAIEWALKTAVLHSRRPGIVVFDGSYHGLDLGALPYTDWPKFKRPFQDLLPKDNVRVLPFGCNKAHLEEAIHNGVPSGPVGTILVEPIQGRAGVRIAPKGWLQDLREVSSTHGLILVADEIFCGLGRAGEWSLASALPADIVCLGKALGGGMPLSACLGLPEIMKSWPESSGEALHTGTFFGHPFSCDAALTTLNTIDALNLVERSRALGERCRKALEKALVPLPIAVRGLGLFLCLEFNRDGAGAKLMDILLPKGYITLASGQRGECLTLSPPLNIEEADIMKFIDSVREAAIEVLNEE